MSTFLCEILEKNCALCYYIRIKVILGAVMKTAIAKKGAYGEKYPLGDSQNGGETQRKSCFSLAYTDTTLRIKIECEVGDKLHCPYNGYNEPVWNGDVAEVFLMPYDDEHWYFEFNLAPNLSCFYARIYNSDGYTGYNRMIVDAGIDAHSKILNGKWTAEMEIPFETMLNKEDLDTFKTLPWRFNVFHIDHELQEHASYSPTKTKNPNFHVTSAFAKLIFE